MVPRLKRLISLYLEECQMRKPVDRNSVTVLGRVNLV